MNVDLPAISLATGIGGLDLGVQLAGKVLGFRCKTLCRVEREAFALAHMDAKAEANQLDPAPVWTDITTFAEVAECFRGKVGLITAGLPCQPWSVSGKRRGWDDERNLWSSFFAILSATEAPLVFVENVANFLRMAGQPVIERLSEMGYRVEAGIYSSAEIGGSHLRRRFFALAYREGFTSGAAYNEANSPAGGRQAWALFGSGGQALVPPLPGDDTGWAEVLASRPDLAPALAHRDGSGRQQKPRGAHGDETTHEGRGTEDDHESTGARKIVAYGSGARTNQGQTGAQSAVLRVVDEPADRMERCLRHRIDRIRAVGNSVDPVVAAVAFIDLASKLEKSR